MITGTKAIPWLGSTVEVLKYSYVSVGLLIAFPFDSVGLGTPRDTVCLQTAGISILGVLKKFHLRSTTQQLCSKVCLNSFDLTLLWLPKKLSWPTVRVGMCERSRGSPEVYERKDSMPRCAKFGGGDGRTRHPDSPSEFRYLVILGLVFNYW